MKFNMHRDRTTNQFYFELVSDEGQSLLTSQAYPDRDGCTEGIQQAIEGLLNTDRFEHRADEDDFYFIVRTADDQELARSPSFGSRQEVDEAIASLQSAAGTAEEYEVTVSRARKSFVSLEARYDFSQRSTSGKPGFEWFWSKKNKRWYFHFNDAQGQAFLYSWPFSTIAQCKERIRSVIKYAPVASRYEKGEQDGQYFFILKARNGREIARSHLFATVEEMEAALAYLSGNAAAYEAEFAKTASAAATGASLYNLSRRSTSGAVGFEAFRSEEDKRYYFHFVDKNGRVLLHSRAYITRSSRDSGLRAVIKNAGSEARYETRIEDGRYYFVLRAGNRRELARSAYFASAAEMAAAIAFLRTAVPGYAAAYGVTLGAAATPQAESFRLRPGAAGAGAVAAGAAAAATTAAAAGTAAAGASGAAAGTAGTAGTATGTAATGAATAGATAASGGTAAAASKKAAAQPRTAAATTGAAPSRQATPRSGDGGVRRWLLRLSPVLAVLLLFVVFRGFDGCESGSADTETLAEGPNQGQQQALIGAQGASEGDDATSGAGGGPEDPSGTAEGAAGTSETGPDAETSPAAGDTETPSTQTAGDTPSEAVPGRETRAAEGQRETPVAVADPTVAQARAADQEQPVNQGQRVNQEQPADQARRAAGEAARAAEAERAAEDARTPQRQLVARQRPAREASKTDQETPAGRQSAARETPLDDPSPADNQRPAGNPSAQPEQEAGPARFDHSQRSWTLVLASHTDQADANAAAEAYREKMGDYPVDVIKQTSDGQTHYRIVAGQFQTLEEMQEMQRGLGNAVPSGAWQMRFTDVIETQQAAAKARASRRPNAATLGFTTGTIEAQIADALSDPTNRSSGMFTMEKVRFSFNSAKLNRDAYQQVTNLALLLNTYPNARIDIYGHIDETENEDSVAPYAEVGSITLSALRARCIYRRIIERGVSAERLGFHGFGATKPLTSAGTSQGKQQNRRIEIVLSRQ